MRKVKIFLASSSELKIERQKFEIEIYRKCKSWFDKDVFLHLDIWEDLSTKVSVNGRSQNDYNEVVKQSDIVVLLAHTKVGIYSAEEFETAYGQFQNTNKPFVFTYFKDTVDVETDNTLNDFKNKLKALNHFYATYSNFDNLWNQFNKELERLFENKFNVMVIENAISGNSDISTLKKPVNIERQINMGDNSTYNENN